jgi:hypothetical protein
MRECVCGERAVIRVDSVLLNELEGRDAVGQFWLCRECVKVCEFCEQPRFYEETWTPQDAHGPWCDLCRLSHSVDSVLFIERPKVLAEISRWERTN